MKSLHKKNLILVIVAAALFLIRWPIDEKMTDPATWPYLPKRGEGATFFKSVFSGGAGTPAIFAMLGGQRYMVANIMWSYSDVLFHKGQPFKMVQPLDACVTLNPSFMEAWSTYGWHLAWNLNFEEKDVVRKAKWMRAGIKVYERDLEKNPDKIQPYFDLAWLYLNRTRDYGKALPYLKAIVNPSATDVHGNKLPNVPKDPNFKFELLKPGDKGYDMEEPKNHDDHDDHASTNATVSANESKWRASREGNRLAYTYRKLGVVLYGETKFESNPVKKQALLDAAKLSFTKAVETYKFAGDKANSGNDNLIALVNMKEVLKNMNNTKWLDEEWEGEKKLRSTYGLPEDPGIDPSVVQ
jgi:tetratricopeptide (TPR) repeat protein